MIEIYVIGTPGPQGKIGGSRGLESDKKTGRFLPKHGGFGTPEYNAWRSMMKRCYCRNNASFGRYGGRGITVCDEWRDSFAAFLSDMGKRDSSLHSLDRIDNNGNYEPDNCRWTTVDVQQLNRNCVVLLELNGDRLSVSQWSKKLGISRSTIKQRLRYGWSVERALTVPVDKRRSSR